jgi:hypothetical protein
MPMTEAEFKLEARIAAIEYMVMDLTVKFHRLIGAPHQAIIQAHDQAQEMLSNSTIPGIDPAQSDAFLGEVEIAVQRLLSGIEAMAGVRRT